MTYIANIVMAVHHDRAHDGVIAPSCRAGQGIRKKMRESKLAVFPARMLVIAVDCQKGVIELPLTAIDDRRWIIRDIHFRKIDSSVFQYAVLIPVVVGEALHF